jgi:hypothetical protein
MNYFNSCGFFFKEIDQYKASTKEDLTQWLTLLRQCGISSDWIIILVKTTILIRPVSVGLGTYIGYRILLITGVGLGSQTVRYVPVAAFD